MNVSTAISLLLTGLVLYILTKTVNLNQVGALIHLFPFHLFVLICILSLIVFLLKAGVFYVLMNALIKEVSFWQMFKVYSASQAVSLIPAGEFFQLFFLKKETGKKVSTLLTIAVIRGFCEVFIASIVTCLGVFWYNMSSLYLPACMLFTVLLLLAILFLISPFDRIARKPNLHSKAMALFKTLAVARKYSFDLLEECHGKSLLEIVLLVLASNTIGGFIVVYVSQFYQIDFSVLAGSFIYSINSIIQGLTTFGGIGVTEGGLAGLLVIFNIDLTDSVTIVLLFRLATLVFPVILGLIILILFYREVFSPSFLSAHKKLQQKES